MDEQDAFEYAKQTQRTEKITPYQKDEFEIVHSAQKCINCGICLSHCPVVKAVGINRFSGPRSIAIELSRSPPEFWSTSDTIYLCTGCGTCREVCPQNVNVPEIVNMIRARIMDHRPDLVPKGLHVVREIIAEHGLAFEPWEDIEEKHESRDMRLERLGLPNLPDSIVENAEVLFYPGCQAEERAQEVREAAKVIFDHFGVQYTLLEEMSCCGLPAKLMGDASLSSDLVSRMKKKVKKSGAKMIVTTCAGCTSNLNDMAEHDDWNIPVYHMLEYLIEKIGPESLEKQLHTVESGTLTKVSVHDPCHLIRHTSRQLHDYILQLLEIIPGVEYVDTGVPDSCCGGGGMVAYHSADVASSIVRENLVGIMSTDADRLVAPCPLCTAQLENSLYRNGSSIEVDDLTVFIAQRLNLRM
ncbi:MAG: (Fe-S)-binding protein [Candidatus Thorarchaeota archaeon]